MSRRARSPGAFDNRLTLIDGSAWPTSGAASNGTTGFTFVNGGTHVGSSDLPPGSVSTGFIQGPADTGDLEFTLGNPSERFQANETDYWTRFWMRFVLTGSALAADGTGTFLSNCQSGGTVLRIRAFLRNLPGNSGYSLSVQESLTGGTEEGLSNHTGAGQGGVIIAFGRWGAFTRHYSRSTANGQIESYWNDVLIGRQSGLPTDGELGAAILQNQASIWHPTQAGTRLQIAGPMTTWDGPGPEMRPLHTLVDV